MKKVLVLSLIAFAIMTTGCGGNGLESSSENVKPRTIITTDGEIDDMDSFIRMLLYSNEFQTEGLIYSSSQWHYAGDGKGTLFTSEMPSTARRYGARTDLRWVGTTWMEELIGKYAEVWPNLIGHDPDFPSPEYLRSIVKTGNIEFEGEMAKDTEGSDLIKEVLLDNEQGPVYVQIWGGTNTLARALKSIEEEYGSTQTWDDIHKKVSEKTVIYAILDQDATYGNYIAPNWPGIRVIYNSAQFWSFAYQWTRAVPEELKTYMNGNWFSENILFGHGALLDNYYTWGDGKKIADPEHTQGISENYTERGMMQYDFISEGDSPSYFYLLDFGLRSLDNPDWGGVGGRFVQSSDNPNRWEDGRDVTDFNPYTDQDDSAYPQVRWISFLQNDFAARADWCVSGYEEANHPPAVTIKGSTDIEAEPGERVDLKAKASDPDGDTVTFNWWQYNEAGTYQDAVAISGENDSEASVTIPQKAVGGETIHIIMEVKDDGMPSLSGFQRVVITVI